jgi:hypothetical protein
MTSRKLAAFRLDPPVIEELQAVNDRDGIPISEQVRRALLAWLVDRGVTETARQGEQPARGPKARQQR